MLKIFANKGEADTIPINAENLNYNFNEVLNLIYPIGSIIIKDSDTDYSNYLGFSWEKVFAGKTLVGLDTSDNDFNLVGKIGGEKTHTLTVDEMPKHYHKQQGSTVENSGKLKVKMIYCDSINTTDTGSTLGNDFGTGVAGGSQAHNNLQPYEVVAFWKRVE